LRRLTLEEILAPESYALVRDDYRARVIEHKSDRRVSVGDKVTLVFEDRETVRYQVQEMARIEGIRDPNGIQQELDVYNELVPGSAELSATLFIEIPDLSLVKRELDDLLGIDECVALVIGAEDTETLVRARFDERQMEADRISAVHYLRFAFTADQIERFAGRELLRLRIDHPSYRHETELCERTRASLLRDLHDEPPQLLEPDTATGVRLDQDELLFESGRVRVWRPARPAASEHVVVAPAEPVASLLSADAELLAELMTVLQRVAADISGRCGRCRIVTEVFSDEADGRGGLRWQLFAP
jgi:hypothetical protein